MEKQFKFMVDFRLPAELTVEFMGLIGDQRAMVNILISERTIENYMLSLEENRLWVVINAGSEYEVMEIIQQLPLTPFMNYKISILTFYNAADAYAPEFSLN